MAEEFAINVAANATKSLISQTWQEVQCLLKYKKSIKELEKKFKELEVKKDTVKLLINEAENNAQVIGPDVKHWLEEVDNAMKEVNEVFEQSRNTQWGYLCCKCPKLHSRYKLSKRALEWTNDVIALLDASKFDKIGYPAPLGQMPFTSPGEFDGFESRIRMRTDVMEALKDDSITTVGVCGMAGVGKTTLVKEIADKVKVEHLFDEIAIAVVSNDPVIAEIQDQLAECLGMKIEEKTDRARAERLYTRLMNKNKRVLVVLDDLWGKLDLHAIGIPVNGNDGGLKIMLTSRFSGVCDDLRATTFEINVLSKEESWKLFKETAEISEEANDIAEEVAKECGGLPLAIVIVAGALKNKRDYVWREVLQQLKESSVTSIPDMRKFVNSRIQLSYDSLEDKSKKLLLLCSLFPEDYNIPLEDLVRCAKGLQWFKTVETMARARDKVYSITDELKNCYLLLVGYKNGVKLHDVVRDVCLSIASSSEHMHMVKHGRLMEWPQEDSYADASSTAISLTFDNINRLPSGLEYPKLEFLQLSFQNNKLHICDDFHEKMKELRVLRLINLNGNLPSSIESLENLRTFCLDDSRLYGHLSVIGSLRNLEILSFYNSCLDYFPNEIAQLSNLKSLDLRFKEGPPLPSGILVSLKKLEELYLGSYLEEWESKGEEEYSGIITDIGKLLNLQTFQLRAYDENCLERVLENLLHLEKLIRFQITRSNEKVVERFQVKKVLDLYCVGVDFLKKRAVEEFLLKTERLRLSEVVGMTDLVSDLDRKGFVNLKSLNLYSCDLVYLVDATNCHTSGGTFINLEQIDIHKAKHLEELCHGNLPSVESFAKLTKLSLSTVPELRSMWGGIQHPCLSNLKDIYLRKCGLKGSLFLQSSFKYLPQLQRISIRKCHQLETVVSNDDKEDEKDTRVFEFPKLKSLTLVNLDRFRSFGPESGLEALFEKVMLGNLESIYISSLYGLKRILHEQMPTGSLSKLRYLEVDYSMHLVVIAASRTIKLLHSLETLSASNNKSLQVVFDFMDLNVEGEESLETPLSRLETLNLSYLPNLKYIWRMLPEQVHAFPNLRFLELRECPKLRYLLSPSMARMLVGLETLKLDKCVQMEAIIGVDETEITEIESDENRIMFPKLSRVEVSKLDNFLMLCSANVDLELPLFTELVIKSCPKMIKFCVRQLSAPKLRDVQVTHSITKSDKVAMDEFNSWLKACESRIRCLDCSYLIEEMCDHLN